jgi:hypothetical protein
LLRRLGFRALDPGLVPGLLVALEVQRRAVAEALGFLARQLAVVVGVALLEIRVDARQALGVALGARAGQELVRRDAAVLVVVVRRRAGHLQARQLAVMVAVAGGEGGRRQLGRVRRHGLAEVGMGPAGMVGVAIRPGHRPAVLRLGRWRRRSAPGGGLRGPRRAGNAVQGHGGASFSHKQTEDLIPIMLAGAPAGAPVRPTWPGRRGRRSPAGPACSSPAPALPPGR